VADYHRCALDSAGAVTCWGSELFGKTAVPTGAYSTVAVARSSSCALDLAGYPVCWGCEDDGREYGFQVDSLQCDPPPVVLSALAPSDAFGVGIKAADGLLAWWSISELDGTYGITTESLGGGLLRIAARSVGFCAILPDGSADCWDSNDIVASPEGAPGPYDQIRAGGRGVCARNPDWTWDCWVPTGYESEVLDGDRYVAAEVGSTSACGIRADDGTLACFGTIAAIPAPEGAFTDVSVAETAACAVRDDGFLVCWGELDRVEEAGNGD
jgi:hypothetical protein